MRHETKPTRAASLVPRNILACMSEADQRALSPSGRTPAEARAAAVAKDERELQRQIAAYLRLRGIWHTQSRMDRRTSNTVGTPDFVFPHAGQYVGWECKCPWSRALRPEQEAARIAIEAQGGQWRLITSVSEAKEHLDELDAKTP